MKKLSIVILFLYFATTELAAQCNEGKIGYNFSIGWLDYNIIKDERFHRSFERKVRFTLEDKIYLSTGLDLKKQISNKLCLNSGFQIAFLNSTQFAEGALFATDLSEKCLINDSCSCFQLKLYDFLIKIPTEFGIFINKRADLNLGLNHYFLIYSHYDYLINESKFNIFSNKGTGRNFSEFPSRYNLSISAAIGFKLFDNIKLTAFYEYFFRDHILAAPSINANIRNIGLKIVYYTKSDCTKL